MLFFCYLFVCLFCFVSAFLNGVCVTVYNGWIKLFVNEKLTLIVLTNRFVTALAGQRGQALWKQAC